MSDDESKKDGEQYLSPMTSLTLSFADDGTQIGQNRSRLFASFDKIADRTVWKNQIVRAFRVWGRILGVKVKVVADQGETFGTDNSAAQPESGQPESGTIRIGGTDFVDDRVAFGFDAQDLSAGSWAGDVIFNTATLVKNPRDIFAVALHEAGHVFGLPDDNRVESIMNPNAASGGLPTIRNEKTLRKLADRYRLRREDISSIDEVNGKWAKSIDSFEMSSRGGIGASFQRRFALQAKTNSRYIRVPGVALKGDETALTLTIVGLGDGVAGNANISVFDENGKKQETFLANRSTNKATLQVIDSNPRESYFVRVDGDKSPGRQVYGLKAEYGPPELELSVAFEGSISETNRRDYHVLDIQSSRLMNLGIRVDEVNDQGFKVRPMWMILRDGQGEIVETFSAKPGGLNDARTLFLQRGQYSLEVLVRGKLTDVDELNYDILSEDPTKPGGPGIIDPSLTPSGPGTQLPGFNLDLHNSPILLSPEVHVGKLWHGPSDTTILGWIAAGGSSGLLPPS